MDELELQLPALEHKTAAEKFKSEFFENKEYVINGSALFDRMEYEEWLIHNTNNRHESTVNPGWVTATTFFAVRKSDLKIIGMIDIRHNLENDFLAKYGGHIGYSVCPSERRKGYATEILRMGIEYAKSLHIKKLMLACFSDNIASIKTIVKNGGVLTETKIYTDDQQVNMPDSKGKLVNIYWIDL
ncbi:GNAT family N-acetyltransferase [Melioribacter sp. OK-6-Me]|uniref:GNAT family N-acetyltransferase n=1 Tax=unclassified Melioribacter TaxID=2627329 RepID=UPI003EDB42D8